ncbi:hypothetical protein ACFX13_044069 [Malus domestica]|uniref:Uncharacterized protein n=1 Tax=Malus domestica TaxID=3750 RepID=A0A498JAD7_MALDO|nr:uncharacterized protein LOC103441149 [Malus domestica]XP_050159865.1 uncharacterized protein LOC126633327 [Malus sylvestris]RXH91805.1 hypothetical protein DVH24_020828 [Malus domestica]
MEPTNTPVIAKKLRNMVRLVLFTLQKGVSKKKLTMMKHGKILGKSFNDFMVRHQTELSCKSDDVQVTSFVYPLEYEFSCTSSPPRRSSYTPPCQSGKVYKGRYVRQHSRRGVYVPMMCEDALATVHGGKKASYRGSDVVEPLPIVRRALVRVTEWEPLLPLSSDEEEDYHVDKAAQEFIDKFYRELMLQKWMAAGRYS